MTKGGTGSMGIFKRITSFSCAICLSIGFASVVHAEEKVVLYVDSNYSGVGKGTFEEPFTTIYEAQKKIREIKSNGEYPEGGITVFFREGEYNLSESLNLNEQDSGTETGAVCYRAYYNEKVQFDGGVAMDFSEFSPADDERIDDSLKGKIYSVNLEEKGIESYDKLYLYGHSAYFIKDGVIDRNGNFGTGITPPVVVFGNEMGTLARYPDEGYMKVNNVLKNGINMYDKSGAFVPTEEEREMIFTVSDTSHIEKWQTAKDAWVYGYWYYDWSDLAIPVKGVDVAKGSIITSEPSPYDMRENQRFYIFNLLEELDTPGEWYYDKDNGELYIYPVSKEAEAKVVLGFSRNNILNIDGAKNIIFRDITIQGTRGNGVNISSKSENIQILYCDIVNIAGSAVETSGYKTLVRGCNINDLGTHGVSASGGDIKTLKSSETVIENCNIHDFGTMRHCYSVGVGVGGVGVTVKNNLIYNGPHTGVTFTGNDHQFKNNEIHSVLKEASDMGVLYSYMNMASRGTVFDGNVIHDIISDSPIWGKFVLYCDGRASGVTFTNNMIYNVDGYAVMLNSGRNNRVENNVFANLKSSALYFAAYSSSQEFDPITYGLTDDIPFKGEAYSKYPGMNDIFEDEPTLPKYNTFKNNILYNSNSSMELNLFSMSAKDAKEKNELEDCIPVTNRNEFIAEENNNFTLKEESKTLGNNPEFKNIDVSKSGLVTSRLNETITDKTFVMKLGSPLTYTGKKKGMLENENTGIVPFKEGEAVYIPLKHISKVMEDDAIWEDGTISFGQYKFYPHTKKAEDGSDEVELTNMLLIKDSKSYISIDDFENLFGFNTFVTEDGTIIISDIDIEGNFDEQMVTELSERLED